MIQTIQHIDLSIEKISFLKRIKILVIITICLKFLAFATLSDSAGMAKIIKTILGLLTSGIIIYLYQLVQQKGFVSHIRTKFIFPVLLYVAYLLLGTISLLWTSDIGVSLLQLVRDYEIFVFAYYLICLQITIEFYTTKISFSWPSLLGPSLLGNIIFFLIGYLIDPETFMRKTHGGEVERLGGQIMNPNELGMLSVVTAVCYIIQFKNQKRNLSLLLGLIPCVWVLLLTGSRSSLIGFVLVTLYFIFTQKNKIIKTITPVALFFAAPIAFNIVFLKEGAGNMEEVMSMTGRLPFWKALLTEGLPREPLLGYGFMRINYTTYFQGENTYPAAMTHNTFIQVLMNLGLIGFSLILIQMASTVSVWLKHKNEFLKRTIFMLFIPVVINSFTEFGIWGEVFYTILIYQIIILSLSLEFAPYYTTNEKNVLKKNGIVSF